MDALPFFDAFRRRTELGEDVDHDVKRVRRIVPREHVCPDQGDLDATIFCERRSLDLRRFGKIERDDVKPLFGQPYAIAPFAVGDRESFARFGQ